MAGASNRKRKATSPLERPQIKRRAQSHTSTASSIVERWLQGHPSHQDEYEFSIDDEEFRAEAPLSDKSSKRRGKYTRHYDPNYLDELAARGSFARSSPAGLDKDDSDMCSQLVWGLHLSPSERQFLQGMPRNCDGLRGLCDLRVFIELFDLISPLALQQSIHTDVLTESLDLNWKKAVPFYGPPPRPDNAYGFQPSSFTDAQKRKLNIKPFHKSHYAARKDIWFPFLTSFVKCGTAARDIAERAVAHAMSVALRGIVDLYRRANCVSEVHQRALGFLIFSDDSNAVVSVHYPEIDAQDNRIILAGQFCLDQVQKKC
ncbi:hypothetical protein CLAIMM_02369 [Cladophialophora immunda]|nr:hypothetical protein CLAIMM_02369 [Cladophialophora immunda]